MKQEVKDIAYELAVRTTPGSFLAWWAGLNWTTVIAVTLGILQILYLVRKWWREETEWGQKLKRWAEGHFTKPGDLR